MGSMNAHQDHSTTRDLIYEATRSIASPNSRHVTRECCKPPRETLKTRVPFAALNAADVVAMQFRRKPKVLLGSAVVLPKRSENCAERLAVGKMSTISHS